MASVGYAVAYTAHLGLAALLTTLAWLAWRSRAGRPALVHLAVFLGLVAAGYAADGLSFVLSEGERIDPLARASVALSRLDTGALLLFALTLAGRRASAPVVAAAYAPGALLALWGYGAPPALVAAQLALFYGAAFVLVVRAYAGADGEVARDRTGVAVVAMGVIVLARLPLTHFDMGLARGTQARASPTTILPIEGGLLLASVAGLALLFALTRPEARAHARGVARSLLVLLAAVGAVWSLRFFPGLGTAVFPLAYAIRWYIVGFVFALGDRRHGALGFATAPVARRALAVSLGVLLTAEIGALLAELGSVPRPLALLGGAAVAGAAAVAWVGLRAAFPAQDAAAERRQAAASARIEIQDARARPPEGPAYPIEGAVFAGRYAVERMIGAGSFGRAYAAWDRARGERVVLKEVSGVADEDALARLAREVEATTRVEHPNVVRFRALAWGARGPVLVVDHVEGETLRARLGRGPLAPAEAERLARDLAAGLGALHAAGVVHRDVKPENIMLMPGGRAVLLDFGEAAVRARHGTQRGSALAGSTPAYASPEQLAGAPPDPRMDVHALAATLWEALSGALPPEGDVPPDWRARLAAGLAKDPRARPGEVGALLGQDTVPRPESR